jgi:hypothetical protein
MRRIMPDRKWAAGQELIRGRSGGREIEPGALNIWKERYIVAIC